MSQVLREHREPIIYLKPFDGVKWTTFTEHPSLCKISTCPILHRGLPFLAFVSKHQFKSGWPHREHPALWRCWGRRDSGIPYPVCLVCLFLPPVPHRPGCRCHGLDTAGPSQVSVLRSQFPGWPCSSGRTSIGGTSLKVIYLVISRAVRLSLKLWLWPGRPRYREDRGSLSRGTVVATWMKQCCFSEGV